MARSAIAVAVAYVGVAAAPASTDGVYTPEQLRALWLRALPAQTVAELEVPFAADEDISAAARRVVGSLTGEQDKLDALIGVFFSGKEAGAIRYNALLSASARETFARGEGNCGSLANLLVAMARGVGLRARFVDASREVSSVANVGTHVVQRGHLTAGAWTETGFRTIDFAPGGRPFVEVRILDDREAVAHHYNNHGYEHLLQDRTAQRVVGDEAVRAFELALAVWPSFGRAHNNLGVALTWRGDLSGAKEHYRAAIAADAELAGPHLNLADLLVAGGDLTRAALHYREARRLEPDNGYAWLKEGLVMRQQGRLTAARELLRGAVARVPGESRAWVPLIQLELSQGDTEEAVELLEEFLVGWPESEWARLHLDRLREIHR